MERYCFELERPIRHGQPAQYAIYDRQRGLYDPMCHTHQADDAQRIVDLLNTATR